MPVEQKILAKLRTNPPATDAAIDEVIARFGTGLPSDYLDFLRVCNGVEGFLTRSYAVLWSAEQLIQYQESYNVVGCAPGLILFGSNGGGEAWGFDCRATSRQIVRIPFVPLDWKEAEVVARSFSDFLAHLGSM
jgi:hypothetical protein